MHVDVQIGTVGVQGCTGREVAKIMELLASRAQQQLSRASCAAASRAAAGAGIAHAIEIVSLRRVLSHITQSGAHGSRVQNQREC